MRTKIDYGIDLGTTNSAVARMEHGNPVIKKSDTLKDTIPSCVSFNQKKDVLVGDAAFNTLKTDRTRALKSFKVENTNTFIEFKRTMGTDTRYPSSRMGHDFSSEELSSEVLKRLKSFVSDETVRSIVITVPAKFTMVQKESTVQAGKLAGFQHIELLQEPIAASMAYGLDTSQKDGIWLVFDFGGGTFDAALIKVEEGIMKVLDTEGDNWLGGQNLDKAIVDQIIIPYLDENFAITSILADKDKKEILRNAVKTYAEECKIQMSFKDNHNILSDLGELPFEDENGEEPILDINVDQAKMQMAVAPLFQKAIDICKDLLLRNHLKGSQLNTLLLVGGPTYSPILRRMLKEQITEQINTSIDPMTSVAKGAALFASTIDVSAEIVEQSRDHTKIQIELVYEATTVETDEIVTLKILRQQTKGDIPDKVFAEIVRGDKAWASGKKQISEKASIVELQLNANTSNAFEIVLYDGQGNRLDCQPSNFNILQGINPGQATLPYHIGIEIVDKALGRDVFKPVKGLEKNKPLPATGTIAGLKTQRAIRPGIITDFIDIPIYQGEHKADGTRAIYNEHVNNVHISGEGLVTVLPAGSEVEITVKVDRSETMTLSVFFPFLNHTEEVPVKLIQKPQVDENRLYQEIRQAQNTAREVEKNLSTSQIQKVAQTLSELQQQLEQEKGSADGKFKILENLRKELRSLDKLQQETEWPIVERELRECFSDLEELVREIREHGAEGQINGDRTQTLISDLRSKMDQSIQKRDIKIARELIDEIEGLIFNIRNAVTDGGEYANLIRYLDSNFDTFEWRDRNKARELVRTGVQLANSGRTGQIGPVLGELFRLMDRDDAEKLTNKLRN